MASLPLPPPHPLLFVPTLALALELKLKPLGGHSLYSDDRDDRRIFGGL